MKGTIDNVAEDIVPKKSRYWGKSPNATSHPYVAYEGTRVWRSVRKALLDLDQNQDVNLTEWHQYVVGYLCQRLDQDGLITPDATAKRTSRGASSKQSAG
jgi:hypothetical protein